PILAVLGAVAKGTTTIRGAGELRIKESDRLSQMARGLRAMGAQVEELPDGLRMEGGSPLHGAEIDSAHDHRIPLALSVAAPPAASRRRIWSQRWTACARSASMDSTSPCRTRRKSRSSSTACTARRRASEQ